MAYELDLPAEIGRAHNVSEPWLLHRVPDDPLPGQIQDVEQPAPVQPYIDSEYEVEAIVDCHRNMPLWDIHNCGKKCFLPYKVIWHDYPQGPDNLSWEPYIDLVWRPDLVKQGHKTNPKRMPMPPRFLELRIQRDIAATDSRGIGSQQGAARNLRCGHDKTRRLLIRTPTTPTGNGATAALTSLSPATHSPRLDRLKKCCDSQQAYCEIQQITMDSRKGRNTGRTIAESDSERWN